MAFKDGETIQKAQMVELLVNEKVSEEDFR